MNTKPFEIGICMAGAVSAGAYTAGAMDYLIEALDKWQAKKGQAGIPDHEVIIKAIGGASAGGMTGIITASAINNPIEHVTEARADLFGQREDNKLYHTWVDLLQDDMFPMMLNNDDIVDGKVYSLINSEFIFEISKRALKVDKANWMVRPYIDNNLKFFTTLTNLEGLKYDTKYNTNQTFDYYLISRHNDYATFILNKSQSQYANDGWIPVDFKHDVNVNIARDSAMATGAFPAGLRSRKVTRNKSYMNDLEWHKDITLTNPVTSNPYEALIVDGGTINNEPFMKVKSLLNNVSNEFDDFGSTVLMIDPFPSTAEKFNVENDSLIDVIGGTLSAMLGHLRTKPEVLEETLMGNSASQFQIAPRRKVDGVMTEGSRAIACGFLGGFGGFIHKEFRIHDFFLGRANCEKFLREHFTVPKDTKNPIFKDGYANVPEDKYCSRDGRRQIIPVIDEAKTEMYMPEFENGTNWPVRDEKDIKRFKKPIKRRAGKIIMNLGEMNWLDTAFLWLGNMLILKGKIGGKAYDAIKQAMEDHKLLIPKKKK